MEWPVLPPKYYLSHFFEFLDFLESRYRDLLETPHTRFLEDFRTLSEGAQCVFVRMVNRKGSIFERTDFLKYSEIENPELALRELEEREFAGPLTSAHVEDLVTSLTKSQLRKWYEAHGIPTSATLARGDLSAVGLENRTRLTITKLENSERYTTQAREAELEYLLFLYFGKIEKSLSLYTLRDLGIRKSGTLKNSFKPRFESLSQARAEYFLAHSREHLSERTSGEELRKIFETSKSLPVLRSSARHLKDDLLLAISDRAFTANDADFALAALAESRHVGAREKAVRFLHKAGRREEELAVLESIRQDPRSMEELLFAEDYLARKFHKKKVGQLTEILQNARTLLLSDLYLKRPEQGVLEHYATLGYRGHFTENYLWMSLFGVLFWEELFDSDEAAIHNPFERSPGDLVGPDFYDRHAKKLEAKMSLLKDVKAAELCVLKTITQNYGRLNDIFQWHPSLTETLLDFLRHSGQQNVAHVLRTIAKNFENYHSGFPDLMVEKDGLIRFIEVKAEGDALRSGQLAKMRILAEAGFEVEVLRIQWQADPQQTYVVVDVETTGGSAGFHRVTEIGAVKVRGGKIIEEFQTLIHPGRPIPPFITRITGITNAMVAEAPPFAEIAEKFLAFTEGAIFVAHNAKFDYGFIQREFSRAGYEFVRPQICTVASMRKAFPGLPSYSLKGLTEHFQISLDSHHRAMCDARAATELLFLINGQRARKSASPADHDPDCESPAPSTEL